MSPIRKPRKPLTPPEPCTCETLHNHCYAGGCKCRRHLQECR